MRIRHAAVAAALAFTAPGIASAATTVTIQNITAAWSDAIPGASFSGSGTGNPTARWGADTGSGQSGYNFDALVGAINTVVPPSPSGDFVLGTFTHVNQPILAPSISSIVLTVTAQVLIAGIDQGSRNFVFDFDHDETPNGDNPCAFGGANNQGVNVNGCADRVRISFSNLSQSFTIGSDIYTLNIRGFDLGGSFTTQFLTTEQQDNPARLVANISLRSDVTDVPEPMTLALFGTALAGLGFAMRRRAA